MHDQSDLPNRSGLISAVLLQRKKETLPRSQCVLYNKGPPQRWHILKAHGQSLGPLGFASLILNGPYLASFEIMAFFFHMVLSLSNQHFCKPACLLLGC